MAKTALVEKKGRIERYRLEDQRQAADALSSIRALQEKYFLASRDDQ